MATKEYNLAAEGNIVVSEMGGRVARNNVGFDHEKRIPYGLGEGSPDWVGWFPLDGRPVPLGIEYKTGRVAVRPKQREWLTAFAKAGCIAIVARCAEDVRTALTQLRAGSYSWGEVWGL